MPQPRVALRQERIHQQADQTIHGEAVEPSRTNRASTPQELAVLPAMFGLVERPGLPPRPRGDLVGMARRSNVSHPPVNLNGRR
jgi:hypothetical protein